MIIMAPASGTPLPEIARLVAADGHRPRCGYLFNRKGLAAGSSVAGGRPAWSVTVPLTSSPRRPPPQPAP